MEVSRETQVQRLESYSAALGRLGSDIIEKIVGAAARAEFEKARLASLGSSSLEEILSFMLGAEPLAIDFGGYKSEEAIYVALDAV